MDILHKNLSLKSILQTSSAWIPTGPYRKSRILLLSVSLLLLSFFCSGQSYPGYHSSSYSGVYGVLTNPADILNHRFRGDVNLFGFFTQLNNNIVSFKYKETEGDNFQRPDPVKKNGRLHFNTDIFGPSLMFRLSDKNALALTTRARLMSNFNGLGPNLLNLTIQDTLNSTLIGAEISVSNISVKVHGWTELGLTYSRQVGITDYGVWKAGVSLKYLSGVGAFSFNTNGLALTYRDSLFDPQSNSYRPAVTNLKGNFSLGYTKNIDSLGSSLKDYISAKNPGIGIDIGVNYEYRDEMQVYETQYSEKTRNYIWRIGASVTDIGFIRYSSQQTSGFSTRFSGKTYFTDTLSPPSDSSSVGQMVNYYQSLFAAGTGPSSITMQLPTAFHLTYDRFFNRWLGVQGQLNIPLIFSSLNGYSGTYNPLSVSITPRAEIPGLGFYLPLSFNSISGFQAGMALRLGPLVVGSGSLISTRFLNKTKGADAYIILRVPFFGYREYKEKIKPERNRLSKKERKALDCPAAN